VPVWQTGPLPHTSQLQGDEPLSDLTQVPGHNLTRPSTLNMDCKGTLPSLWTVGERGKQVQGQEQMSNYPWVFFNANNQEKKAVIYSQALYQRDNINVV